MALVPSSFSFRMLRGTSWKQVYRISIRMSRGTSSKQVYRISICDNCHAASRRRLHMKVFLTHRMNVLWLQLTITFVCKQVSTFLLNLVKRWLGRKSELFCLGQLATGVKRWSFLSSQVSATTKIFPSLRGRRSKGKGKGIRARDHARGRRERAPRVSLALKTPFSKTPFPFPFKRLPRRLNFSKSNPQMFCDKLNVKAS